MNTAYQANRPRPPTGNGESPKAQQRERNLTIQTDHSLPGSRKATRLAKNKSSQDGTVADTGTGSRQILRAKFGHTSPRDQACTRLVEVLHSNIAAINSSRDGSHQPFAGGGPHETLTASLLASADRSQPEAQSPLGLAEDDVSISVSKGAKADSLKEQECSPPGLMEA